MRRAFLRCLVAVAFTPSVADTPEVARPELAAALGALAERAEVASSLRFRMECFEQVLRRVRREQRGEDPIFVTGNANEMRRGVVVERGDDGVLTNRRVRVNRKQEIRRGRGGEPIEAGVSERFEPIASSYPHAMAGAFGAAEQADLRFEVLTGEGDPGSFRIVCPQPEQLAVEFIDRDPPRKSDGADGPSCDARPSGQMCLDRERGEITRIVFYGLELVGDVCGWQVENPPVRIWQDVVEKTSRLRFPSRVETEQSLDSRNTAVFVQRFEKCVFTEVRVSSGK